MNRTALVYSFDGLTTREQVVILYQLVVTVYPFGLRIQAGTACTPMR